MRRTGFQWVALALLMLTLQACQRPGPGPGPDSDTAAASAPAGAADDSPGALMAQVFAGWKADAPHAVDMPAEPGSPEKTSRVLVSPMQVIALDADHRALVVAGPLDGGRGEPVDGHATGASVSVYGFERRDGRWFATFARPALTWTGFFGTPGELKQQALAPGRVALSIENGSCWQGFCGSWVEVFGVTAAGVQPLFNERIATSAAGAVEGCSEWLEGKKADAAEASLTADNCFDIQGTWRFEAATGTGWPDAVLTFTGTEAAQEPPGAPLTRRTIDEQRVLRHDGTTYRPLHGRNPTHDI
ncbi:hypothetical protein [Roseateles sp. BYS87W]|uniref:Lipoprotein n=1 Tax=Pelomonas baiyunensis TaxID=3299026 RepID=A0ABW7GZ06_9BURK